MRGLLTKQLKDQIASVRVEAPGGLISQNQQGLVDNGPSNCDPLHLSPREGVRHRCRPVRQADPFKNLLRLSLSDINVGPVQDERHHHILKNRESRKEVELLEYVAQLGSPQPLQGHLRRHVRCHAPDSHLTTRRTFGQSEDIEQGALTTPRWTNQSHELTALDGKVNTLEHLHRRTTREEGFR